MTDNRTTELREKLTERGIEYTTNDHMGAYETSWDGFTAMQLTPSAKLIMAVTPEQAIAATLGNSRVDYHGYEQAAIEAWESIKAWNSRAERTCHILENFELPYSICSECGAIQPDDFAVYYCWSCGCKVVDK